MFCSRGDLFIVLNRQVENVSDRATILPVSYFDLMNEILDACGRRRSQTFAVSDFQLCNPILNISDMYIMISLSDLLHFDSIHNRVF